jgi:hypothetical protein
MKENSGLERLSSTRNLNNQVQELISAQIGIFQRPGSLNPDDLREFRNQSQILRNLIAELDRLNSTDSRAFVVRNESHPD